MISLYNELFDAKTQPFHANMGRHLMLVPGHKQWEPAAFPPRGKAPIRLPPLKSYNILDSRAPDSVQNPPSHPMPSPCPWSANYSSAGWSGSAPRPPKILGAKFHQPTPSMHASTTKAPMRKRRVRGLDVMFLKLNSPTDGFGLGFGPGLVPLLFGALAIRRVVERARRCASAADDRIAGRARRVMTAAIACSERDCYALDMCGCLTALMFASCAVFPEAESSHRRVARIFITRVGMIRAQLCLST